MPRPLAALTTELALLLAGLAFTACSSGDRWIRGDRDPSDLGEGRGGWVDAEPAAPAATGAPRTGGRTPASGPTWRNTYYDFPAEDAGAKSAMVYDAECRPIAPVSPTFHDKVCVQGSGQLSSGATISFAKRDCPCAAVCPRTAQRICFEKLDPARFPHGRGAAGTAITPFRSVAVDTALVPLGTTLFIPEYQGLKMLDGVVHDGCFVAADRGLKVVGRHVDVFTGSEAGTVAWNRAVPSNDGVHVVLSVPECRRLAP